MLKILTSKIARRKAQQIMMVNIKSSLTDIGPTNMGFPGGNITTKMYSMGNSRLSYAYFKTDGVNGIERYWNAFGLFDPARVSQDIVVEINIAVESESQQVAAFFAEDTKSGRKYILHSGKIGGGRAGVGRNAFLVWSKNRLIPTYNSDGKPARLGILLGPVDDDSISRRLERFTKQVAEFKAAVRAGEVGDQELKDASEEIERYKAEFSGQKKGKHSSIEIDYVCLRGEVVDALYNLRYSIREKYEMIGNTNLIDLFVKKSSALKEVYEVKTSIDRQALYTAIGQLIVHGRDEAVARYLVLPSGEALPTDIRQALSTHQICVKRYTRHAFDNYDFS